MKHLLLKGITTLLWALSVLHPCLAEQHIIDGLGDVGEVSGGGGSIPEGYVSSNWDLFFKGFMLTFSLQQSAISLTEFPNGWTGKPIAIEPESNEARFQKLETHQSGMVDLGKELGYEISRVVPQGDWDALLWDAGDPVEIPTGTVAMVRLADDQVNTALLEVTYYKLLT